MYINKIRPRCAVGRRLRAAGYALALTLGFMVAGTSPAWAVAPANDNFANAQAHSGSFNDTVNTADATLETGEPDVCYPPTTNSVWYALTPVGSGTATVDTIGSDYDTSLEVFTGSSITGLTLVTCNDDGPGIGLASTLTFNVVASTTYYIRAVDWTASGAGGNLDLNAVVNVSAPDLTTTMTESADPVALGGDDLTYTVAVTNNGTAAATGVSTATTLSGASATIVSASSSQGSCSISAPTVTCTVGGLAVSAGATITVVVSPNATGTVTATAVSTLNETDANTTDNTDAESTTVNNALGCTITGTSGNDTLNGTGGADVICGLGGDDTIDGDAGDDTIYGGNGTDTITGGPGTDLIHGGNGGDHIAGGNGNDTLYGGTGNDDLDGQKGDDTLYDHDGTDTMSGNVGNDNIDVQDSVSGDTANGGLGSDTCTVDAGDTTSSC